MMDCRVSSKTVRSSALINGNLITGSARGLCNVEPSHKHAKVFVVC